MSGLTIELIKDYFIEVDELNHTLKKRYMGTDKKTGEKKPAEHALEQMKEVQDAN